MIENDDSLESDVGSSERSTSLFRLLDRLFLPVDNASITLLRIGLGAMFAWWAWDYLASGLVHSIYIEPKFHFNYWPFGWVHPLQPNGMIAVFVAIILLGILVCAGVFYRWSSLLLALCFTYVFLLERTNYQNHYYLLILIAWWLPWLPLAKNVSYDASRNSSGFESTAQAWALWLLRFHVGLPYVYGGLAKLHGDWLAGEPMRQILASRNQLPFVGPWFNEEWIVFAFVWGGLLFDLAIVPLLLFKRTRVVAYLACVGFHLTNAVIFNIHVFPWFMIFATTLFFEPDWPRRVLGGTPLVLSPSKSLRWAEIPSRSKWGLGLVLVYCLFQCTWPFRHFTSEGDASWTERGHMFSWRMMLRGKTAAVRYFVSDDNTNQTYIPRLKGVISVDQANRFPRDPEMILQFAHFLAREHKGRTGRVPRVQALVLTSLNGRKPQLFIDPNVDLASEPTYAGSRKWILPLTEPLRKAPWKIPLNEWEKHVDLPKLPVGNAREP